MRPENVIRTILNSGKNSIATRISSTRPVITEAVGATNNFDYIEFTAEYSPFEQADLENIVRAAELSHLGSMIKVDFQNRFYTAQKAMAAGFQSVLLTDHKNAVEVENTIRTLRPDTITDGGRFGYPRTRWIGYHPYLSQMDYADMVRNTVFAVMIEKKESVEDIKAICSVPGVDMVQFGPSDYSMSCDRNASEFVRECQDAEKRVIEIALENNVQPRCEINNATEADYYIRLGVKHFSLGDELRNNIIYWEKEGTSLKNKVAKI
jgi:2-keto-3-deoxy-L-rhamnonate aldolase RhmA